MQTLLSYLYNLVLSLWVGGIFIFTFIVTPVIFKSYERDMAGSIVGYLFPYYFKFTLILSVLSLVFFLVLNNTYVKWAYKSSLVLLIAALGFNLLSTFVIHPKARGLKKEIHAFSERTDKEGVQDVSSARKAFRRLHALSMVVNLVVLIDGAALLFLSMYLQKGG